MRNKSFLAIILITSIIGFICSLSLHVTSLLGVFTTVDTRNDIMYWLAIGLFIVWVPTLCLALKAEKGQWLNIFSFFKPIVKYSPKWVKTCCLIICIYGGILFLDSSSVTTGLIINERGSPSEVNGNWVLSDHGNTIRKMTAQEIQRRQTYDSYGWSSLLMTFYCVPILVFNSGFNERHKKRTEYN